MRICLVAPAPSPVGEVGHSVAELARVLAGRHEVTLIRSGEVGEWPAVSQSNGGVRELVARPSEELRRLSVSCEDHRHSAAVLEAIHAAYGDSGPDYLEVCDLAAHGLVPLQARQTGDPALLDTLVGVRASPSSELLALHDGTTSLGENERVAALEREQLRLADLLVWPGGDVLELYRRHYNDAGLPEPVRIPPAARAGAPPASSPVGTGSGPLRILFVGDLRRSTGALDLVEACCWLGSDEWELTMVGNDTETATMGQSVRLTIEAMSGDDPRIRIEEPGPGATPAVDWSGHDLLVVPALLDVWSTIAIEAMGAGLPVLATPVGGLVEIVEDGVSGWHSESAGIEPLRRALMRLIGDRGELERVQASGAVAERGRRLADPGSILDAYDRLAPAAIPAPARPTGEPLVTGVVPYHRTDRYVAEAVGSLLGQTHRNLEVLIVNDGSFAAEDAILADLAADPRVRVVTQVNRGECTARNLGNVLARGEYLAMLDADNLLEPEFVARALDAYRRDPALAYVTCWLRMVFADGSEMPAGSGYAALGNAVLQEDAENWDGDTMAMIPGRIFSELGFRYDPRGSMHSDWDLYRVLRAKGLFGAVIPERLARYRVLPDSLLRGHGEQLQRRGWAESRDRRRLWQVGRGRRLGAGERTADGG
jgi:glycosyltransferase involved in cell wall biosynthesis